MSTIYDVNEPGLRLQAQRRYDADAQRRNYDTSQTSRPDAVPMWDDLSKLEQDILMFAWDATGELTEYAEVEWLGSDVAVIESQTNPWLRDEAGNDIQLDTLIGLLENEAGDCTDCGGLLPGVLNMDNEYGIQRCDTCMVYDGDLIAARALRDAHFPGATIWFNGTN